MMPRHIHAPLRTAARPMQHCTNDLHRKSSADCWPLRGPDGMTFAERKAKKVFQAASPDHRDGKTAPAFEAGRRGKDQP